MKPEFSRPVAIERIATARDGTEVTVSAEPAECAALAARILFVPAQRRVLGRLILRAKDVSELERLKGEERLRVADRLRRATAIEAINLLGTAEGLIKTLLIAQPQDAEAAATLALILTRQGKFTDAVPLAQRLVASNPGNARIAYRVAQMYALQMYSGKTLSVDEPTKKLCIETLQSALAADYRFEELANGDFYNMYEHGDFASVIQVPLR